MIDAHCHILPNCDDGARNIEESKKMLKTAKSSGIDKIICTSHIKHEYAGYEQQIKQFKEIQKLAGKLDIQTQHGCEVHWKKIAEYDIKEIKKFKFGNSNLFLLEFSYPGVPDTWKNIVKMLQKEGYKVIIAHPERYLSVHKHFKQLKEFREARCLIMLSATSFNKEVHEKPVWKTAKKMLKRGFVDIISSDAHNTNDYAYLPQVLELAKKYHYDINNADRILKAVF